MADSWTGGDAPGRAVPVFDQRCDGAASSLLPNSPHVVAGDAVHCGELPTLDGRRGNDTPTRAVEMLGERLKWPAPSPDSANCPDVVIRDCRSAAEA